MRINLRQHINRRTVINAIAILVIIYISVSTLRVMTRNFRLQQEVDALEEEIALLKLRNQEFEYKIAYFQTDSFADKEARDKLNLQAPGEKVIIFPDKVPTDVNLETDSSRPGISAAESLDNFEQWLYFLFRKEPS